MFQNGLTTQIESRTGSFRLNLQQRNMIVFPASTYINPISYKICVTTISLLIALKLTPLHLFDSFNFPVLICFNGIIPARPMFYHGIVSIWHH